MKRRYFNFLQVLLASMLSCLIVVSSAEALPPEVTTQGVVVTYAGTGAAGNTNGPLLSSTFNNPTYMVIDSDGHLYIPSGNAIRVIDGSEVLLYSGDIVNAGGAVPNPGTPPPATISSTIAAARYDGPQSLAFDSAGNLWVADTLNYSVRRINDNSNKVISAAGTGLIASTNGNSVNVAGNAATFNLIGGLAIDGANNVYVSIDPQGSNTNSAYVIQGLSGGSGSSATAESVKVNTVAGTSGSYGSDNENTGTPLTAKFGNASGGLGAMVVDKLNQILYLVDNGNNSIRKWDLVTDDISTLTGAAGNGYQDGTLLAAKFSNNIKSIIIDASGNLYVADAGNQVIRKIVPGGGSDAVTTIAGLAGSAGATDGTLDVATFHNPAGLVFDSNGIMYIADSTNNKIRQIVSVPDFSQFDTGGLFPGVQALAVTLTDQAVNDAITHNASDLALLSEFLDLTPDQQYGRLVSMLYFTLPTGTPLQAIELQEHLLDIANQIIADGNALTDPLFPFIEGLFTGSDATRAETLVGLLPLQYPSSLHSLSNSYNQVFEAQSTRTYGMREDALIYRKRKNLNELTMPSSFVNQSAGVTDKMQLMHAFNTDSPITPVVFAEDRGGVWIQPFSTHFTQRPRETGIGIKDRLRGFMGGIDYRASQNRIYGLSLGHLKNKLTFDEVVGDGEITGTGNVTGRFISPYFSGSTDKYSGDFALLLAMNKFTFTRTVDSTTYTANEHGRSLGLRGRGARNYDISPNWKWAPFIDEEYLLLHTGGYDEGPGGLSVGKRNPSFLRNEIGMEINGSFPLSKSEHSDKLLVQSWMSYVYKTIVQGESASIIIDTPSGPLPGAFSYDGKQKDRNFVTLGFSAQYIGPYGLFASTNYATEYAKHSTAHKWSLNLGSRF